MKQFNLEAALAGAEVITRDGRKVTQLHILDVTSRRSLLGVVEHEGKKIAADWDLSGRRFSKTDKPLDLFMPSFERLTDEEIAYIAVLFKTFETVTFARAIEAALEAKNK